MSHQSAAARPRVRITRRGRVAAACVLVLTLLVASRALRPDHRAPATTAAQAAVVSSAPVAADAAVRADALGVAQAVGQCERSDGVLPYSASGLDQLRLMCANGVLSVALHPGVDVDYTRGSDGFTVRATAADGASAVYDSATGRVRSGG